MLTLIYAYFENGSMLDLHLKTWSAYENKDQWKAIIVDDCSLRDPAETHIADVGFPVELYRIKTDIPWNQDGSRNLAMHQASGWCLMTDMDHLLRPLEAGQLLRLKKNDGHYYMPSRRLSDGSTYHRHPNSYLLNKGLYEYLGGYDEAYAGYYGTDGMFRERLSESAFRVDLDIPLFLYKREAIPDASTTDYGRKGSAYALSSRPDLVQRRKSHLPPIPPLNFEWERVR